jgi:predicted transcriptional regulator
MGGVPAAKPTISLDPDLRDQIEAAASQAGVSFSAWMADAARQRLRKERLLGLIAEWEAEHGEFTESEVAAVRAELGIGRRGKKTA